MLWRLQIESSHLWRLPQALGAFSLLTSSLSVQLRNRCGEVERILLGLVSFCLAMSAFWAWKSSLHLFILLRIGIALNENLWISTRQSCGRERSLKVNIYSWRWMATCIEWGMATDNMAFFVTNSVCGFRTFSPNFSGRSSPTSGFPHLIKLREIFGMRWEGAKRGWFIGYLG